MLESFWLGDQTIVIAPQGEVTHAYLLFDVEDMAEQIANGCLAVVVTS